MSKLYELQDQLVAIDAILAENTDPETEEILESAKEELLKQVGDKIENILDYVSDCKAKMEQLKSEEERLAKKRKSIERKVDYLKKIVFDTMKINNQNRAEYGTWNLSIVQTPPKVVIDDEQWIPQEFIKTTIAVDKTALKSVMTDGKFVVKVDGHDIQIAHTERSESLRIA